MTKIEAEALLVKAVQCGCNGVVKPLRDGSWRVYVSKGGRWTFVNDNDDFDDALANPELWVKGKF